MLQYCGGLLPLEDPGGLLSETDAGDDLTVVICRRDEGNARVGLVVRRVLDIAAGEVLPESAGRIALVEKRLAVVHEDAMKPRRKRLLKAVA